MTSITDVPLNDIMSFLKRNNIRISKNDEDNYNTVFDLIIEGKGTNHPDSLINWIIAYNFRFSGIPLKNYKTIEIEKLNNKELSTLAKKLDSDRSDKETILNILTYLHKIDDYKLLSEDIKFAELLPKLGLETFLSLCATDNKHRHLCDNDRFWKNLWNKDYGIDKLNDKSYKDNYILAYQAERLYKIVGDYRRAFDPNNIHMFLQITDLNVYGRRLEMLPKEIAILTNLKTLILTNNKLSSLPKEIGKLINLQFLYLEGNELTEIPKEIGDLVNLEVLHLEYNKLTRLPTEIGNLVKLETLGLNLNLITELPKEIGNLVKLVKLNVNGNKITEIPKEICNLPNLEQLYVSNNQITALPKEIGNLIDLVILAFDGNEITEIPKEVGNFYKLGQLYAHNNEITALPKEIGNLVNLVTLKVDGNEITALPKEIGNLVNLVVLGVDGNNITFLPKEILNLKQLENFSYYGQRFTNQDVLENLLKIVEGNRDSEEY